MLEIVGPVFWIFIGVIATKASDLVWQSFTGRHSDKQRYQQITNFLTPEYIAELTGMFEGKRQATVFPESYDNETRNKLKFIVSSFELCKFRSKTMQRAADQLMNSVLELMDHTEIWSKIMQDEPSNASQDFAYLETVDAVGEGLADKIFETREAYQKFWDLGSRLLDSRLFT